MKNTLKKEKEISILFSNGNYIKNNVVSAMWCKTTLDSKYMVSAPYKNFKRAVDRNKIKRLLRNSILKHNIKNINIAFIYSAKDIKNGNEIDADITDILNKINRKIKIQ